MRSTTDSWFVVDGEATPVPENDAGDPRPDRRARLRVALVSVGIAGVLLVAFLGILAFSLPANGVAAAAAGAAPVAPLAPTTQAPSLPTPVTSVQTPSTAIPAELPPTHDTAATPPTQNTAPISHHKKIAAHRQKRGRR
jgi:hypothetical protein